MTSHSKKVPDKYKVKNTEKEGNTEFKLLLNLYYRNLININIWIKATQFFFILSEGESTILIEK